MRIRTILIGVGIFALVTPTVILMAQQGAMPPLAAARAEKGTLVETVQVTGKVVSSREIEIKCKASGAVLHVGVQESSPVTKGDVLVELDPIDEQRLMRQAEIARASSHARLEQAKVGLAVAQAELVSERSRAGSALSAAVTRNQEVVDRATRAKTLCDQGLVSAEESAREQSSAAEFGDLLAAARQRISDLATREHSLELKRQDLALAAAQVDSDTIAVSIAKQRLADTRIIAPIDGVATKVMVAEGQIVSSGISSYGGGTAVMVLSDTRLEVVAQVDESDIAKISIGQEVQINTNSFPGRKWKGSVARVAAKGTPQNSAVQFEVRIALAAAATIGLRPEMTATVVVTTATARDAVLVPVAAVTWCKDKAYVTMQADGKEVEITPGANNGEKLQVLEGVAAGAVLSLPTKSGGSRWRRDTIFQ